MKKIEKLQQILLGLEKIAVAFSGGVDSTFLLIAAKETLGSKNVIAVTATAPNFAPDEIAYAKDMAVKLGIRHLYIEITLPALFRSNQQDRCYHCKKAVFSELMAELAEKTAAEGGGFVFCDGSNFDDISDYRPGSRAALELGVRSPLREAALTKKEIRTALKERGVDIWDKPAFACLASRIPYGTQITDEMLSVVYDIEKMLRDKGYTQVRARLHKDVVRLELLPDEMQRLLADRDFSRILSDYARERGFAYTTLDLCGYQMGSLNNVL